MRPRVAVLGLGAMGLPMAARLREGTDVRAFDVAAERLAAAAAAGVETVTTPAAAVRGASIAVVAVRTLEQAEGCLFGAEGAAGVLAAGSVVLLTSTVGAPGAVALAERLRAQEIELVDAPVSGGPARAGSGQLLIMVGGSDEAIEKARPALDLLAATVAVVGPSAGSGQALKTVNQLLCGVHIAAAAEALVLAQGLGLDPEVALRALEAGAAASFMLGDRGPRVVEALRGETPEVRSRVDIFVKDLGIVAAASEEAGLELPVTAASLRLFREGVAAGLGAADDSTISVVLSGTLSGA